SVLKGFCNAGEAVLVAWLIERWFGRPFVFDCLLRVAGFITAVCAATALAAIGGAATMVLLHSSAPFWEVWEAWVLSDAIGLVVVAPMVIEFGNARREGLTAPEVVEGIGVLVLLTLICVFVTLQPPQSWITFGPSALTMPLLL